MWDPADPGAGPAELGRHDGAVAAVAVLPDGRVVTGGGDGRVLVWDPADPGAGPAELGRHDGRGGGGGGAAGRAGGHRRRHDGRVLVWDPADPGAGPAELGRHDGRVAAVAVLPDGRVVTGGDDGRVLVWDPADPGAGPVELGRHDGGVRRWRCCRTGGWSAAADDDRVRLWNVREQLTRHSARMLRVRARYFPLPIWSSPLHRSRSGRNFMLGGMPSDTEHAWSPATCG